MSNPSEIAEILGNPSTSYWLKNAVESSVKHDPVDALSDAETLLGILQRRLDHIASCFAQANDSHSK